MVQIKRTYDPPARSDGQRFLVERLWPRGLTKAAVAADAWVKDVAPSTALRKWFDHRVERWDEFRRKYRAELRGNPAGWQRILAASKRGRVTLLYSAHDPVHNGAIVLRDFLTEQLARTTSRRNARRVGSSKRAPARFAPASRSGALHRV